MDQEREISDHLERGRARRELESSAMGKMLEKLCKETLPKLSKERLREIVGEAAETSCSKPPKKITPGFKLTLVEANETKKRVELVSVPDQRTKPIQVPPIDQLPKKPYACQNCDSSYSRRQGLVKHKSEKHSDKPKLNCKKCDKSFDHGRTFELQRHERSCLVKTLLLVNDSMLNKKT